MKFPIELGNDYSLVSNEVGNAEIAYKGEVLPRQTSWTLTAEPCGIYVRVNLALDVGLEKEQPNDKTKGDNPSVAPEDEPDLNKMVEEIREKLESK